MGDVNIQLAIVEYRYNYCGFGVQIKISACSRPMECYS